MLTPFDQILTQDSFGMFNPLKEIKLEPAKHFQHCVNCSELYMADDDDDLGLCKKCEGEL